ncbi:hypothetical protein [Clostridium sp. M14]|uniref:hypothetical protein n=1 Tax=Clostridium sp. M14 TaxID=2716311 RepID=UPI0013EE8548|nr:hypothetical protein [Clostridium sp. M14]MBZ9693344.1 hypothetical protein [Clostridium sp. M14]
MLDKRIQERLIVEAQELLKEKQLEYPDGEIEIVNVPVVITRKDGHIACISSNYKNIIR